MLRDTEEVSKEEPKILRRTQRFLDLRELHIFTTDVYLPCVRAGLVTMVQRQEVPNVHIFSTRAGDMIVRPDLDCYLLLPPLPTSPCADLRPLHPSLRSGEHYFSSRWRDSIYIIRGNKLLEAEDLTAGASKPARLLHASCFGGQRYFVVAGGSIGIIMGPGTVTAVKDLSTGEPDPEVALGPRRWFKEKMGSSRSYLYWQLWDPFNGEFFSFHPKILSFLPGGLGLLKGSAFGVWKLLETIRNDSDTPVTRAHRITQRVGCATETLADIGDAWTVSSSDAPKPGSVAVAIAKAQFALPVRYGGLGLNTEQEEWEELLYKEKTLQFTLQTQEAAYVWQYQLGLGKETVLFCREVRVTHSRDPPSEIPLPPSS